jgi:hypothetical protein
MYRDMAASIATSHAKREPEPRPKGRQPKKRSSATLPQMPPGCFLKRANVSSTDDDQGSRSSATPNTDTNTDTNTHTRDGREWPDVRGPACSVSRYALKGRSDQAHVWIHDGFVYVAEHDPVE